MTRLSPAGLAEKYPKWAIEIALELIGNSDSGHPDEHTKKKRS